MKKITPFVVAALVSLAFYVWYKTRPAAPQPVIQQKDDKEKEKKPVPAQKPEPEGALSFWSGEIIVGDPDSQWWGYVELLAHEGRKSKLLIVGKDGICRFDPIPGMKPGDMYMRFKQWDKAPSFSLAEFRKGQEQPTHPVYQLNERAKKRPVGAIITYKAIGDPLTEVRPRQQGQFFEGRTWSLASHNQQLLGHE